jgi:signal transduction histidine kinase
MTMRDEWSPNDYHLSHHPLYYAVVNHAGRILSMNVAMNKEFGPGSVQPIEYFQSLLEENDKMYFTTLVQSKDVTLHRPVPVSLYTYAGPHKQYPVKWTFFHLLSETGLTGNMLCAGYSNEQATQAEDITTVTQQTDPAPKPNKKQKTTTSNPMVQSSDKLLKILESERVLIGQELHDNVNQLLCSAKLHLEVLEVYKADNVEAKETTQQLLIEAIEEIKKLSRGLVLQQLKKETLLESIRALIDDFKTLNKIDIIFGIHHFEEELLSVNKKFNIYRIVQEQLRNIQDHSKAKTAVITLETENNNIELIIDDDGVGFDTHVQVNGIGLINIRERVRMLNGHCEITSSPGKGCRVHIEIPV